MSWDLYRSGSPTLGAVVLDVTGSTTTPWAIADLAGDGTALASRARTIARCDDSKPYMSPGAIHFADSAGGLI
jgi:hypothetical protein